MRLGCAFWQFFFGVWEPTWQPDSCNPRPERYWALALRRVRWAARIQLVAWVQLGPACCLSQVAGTVVPVEALGEFSVQQLANSAWAHAKAGQLDEVLFADGYGQQSCVSARSLRWASPSARGRLRRRRKWKCASQVASRKYRGAERHTAFEQNSLYSIKKE